MIFGRKRKREQEDAQTAPGPETTPTSPVEIDDEDGDEDVFGEEAPEAEAQEDPRQAEWAVWDAEFDREEGPFDVDEVDLEADEVKRIDLGTLIVTPFPKMSMQLQVDKTKEKVQAILVADGQSAIEVAVFAGPVRTSMLGEIRDGIIGATERASGRVEVVRGPFGAEVHRRLPVTDAKGNPAMHMSRTWLVDGPGWVLRGVVMGKAALDHRNEAAQLTLFEFFSNLVVRRGIDPAVPGSVLPMTVPVLEKKPDEDAEAAPDAEAAEQ